MTKENDKKEVKSCSRKMPFEAVEIEKDGKKELSWKLVPENDSIVQDLTGTPNDYLARYIITAGICALPKNIGEEAKCNLIHQSLADAQPQDAIEARLVTQAAILNAAGLDYLQRARSVLGDDETFAKDHWHVILMNTATKLINLHLKTVEALTRYRQKGEQKIIVQHMQNVQVNNGGKAIVNNTVTAGGGDDKKGEVLHGQRGINAAMPGEIEAVGEPMPQLCHERQACLSDTWREKHGIENSGGASAAKDGELEARRTVKRSNGRKQRSS